jgi:hypothetical protein
LKRNLLHKHPKKKKKKLGRQQELVKNLLEQVLQNRLIRLLRKQSERLTSQTSNSVNDTKDM